MLLLFTMYFVISCVNICWPQLGFSFSSLYWHFVWLLEIVRQFAHIFVGTNNTLFKQYQFYTISFIIQIKWDTLLYLLPCTAALYVRPLYSKFTIFDDAVQGYLSVLKVNYENSNVLSSAKRSVKSETSYEAVISGWLAGL
jgi:hypothetical protein